MIDSETVGSQIGKRISDGIKSAQEVINAENPGGVSVKVTMAIEALGRKLRSEMEQVHRTYRDELEKSRAEMQLHFEQERRHLRKVAYWQWITLIAAILTALVKEILL